MAEVSAPRACVYTCLIGGYEALNEQPMAAASALDFLCFTDDPTHTSASWTLLPCKPAFPLDPVRSQRMVKLSPHDVLPGYDVSLYIDNSVILTVPPEEVIARYLPPGTPAAMPGHSFRASVRDEFMEVLRMGLDDGGRVLEQLNHYVMSDPAALDPAPYWSAIMLRRHHEPDVIATMRLWLAQVLRYSRRDQLSGTYALRRTGLEMRRFEVDNLESWFHRWPVTEARDRAAFPFSPILSQVPAALLAEDWRRDRAALEARIGVLEQALAAAETGATRLEASKAARPDSATSAESEPDCAPAPPISIPNGTRTSPTSSPVSWLARLASRLSGRRRS
ncbi:glycosyltransferase domain-containing protein [Xanthobacter flavus]|uniref:glycosyltransferase domain-containing protein n=1 Tax=Xanthobacter flavus TaxID=281 RepID=UPI00372A9E4B